MATPSDAAPPALTATYTNQSAAAPSTPFTHSTPLPALAASSPSSSPAPGGGPPTAFLHALREAVLATQGRINTDLTARMEEDKARDAATAAVAAGGSDQTADLAGGGGKGKKKKNNNNNGAKRRKVEVDEDAEEANYGEEVVDGEDD
jgi:hypothetical protein